jgi:D-3-phosphoglycerate dehydrogenase / 2-oxoglutarate reductase
MLKVLLTDQVFPTIDVEREILAQVGAEIVVLDDPSPESIRDHGSEAVALLNTYAAIDEETFSQLKACKIVARYGIGVDNIDLDAAREHGVRVTNVPDYCVEEVADHTLALILAATRKIVVGDTHVKTGGWGIDPLKPVHRLRGRALGLIGFGNIARSVASRAQAFGLTVRAHDPFIDEGVFHSANVERVASIDRLLEASDVVSVHVPLLEETRGLIDDRAIGLMRPGAVLVNTSRGPIVEVEAVVSGLRRGHLGGAGLDVFPTEPPDDSLLRDVDNLVTTPHAAFYSEDSIRESQTKAAGCIAAVLRGEEPLYKVV